jgi:preprotein translocase subunit YajC
MFITDAYANGTISSHSTNDVVPVSHEVQSVWTSMVPIALIFVVFYFLLIRPQEKRRRLQETLVSSVKKGEEVLTNSGIFGVVVKINDADNTVEIEVAKDVQIKILKSAIADIINRKNDQKKEEKASKVIKQKGGSRAKTS